MIFDFDAIRRIFLYHLYRLGNFHFTFTNPVFWLFLLLLFLTLLTFWRLKKALSFSLIVALILLGATKFENFLGNIFTGSGESFDPTMVRLLSITFIAFIFIYYAFIKRDKD